ncbi:DUF1700 domain-containing protein [Blautia sp. MSJ-19]|uniref:DUF1700 domain-containing protein n=1 Tax=Blautia sp. MSJ-19 TaxID=2841517 RepID=UPI001C0EDF4B|nr:DUF1700 domain-containing protein [Blautia sp. MSJ-19]MBU5480981.1 DUF1700 domain-containing protein [Blautia sp. MSJ-19]
MDKNEFLDILRSQLSGQMPESQINTHIQYYRNYIEERMQSGNSESEIMNELGDPRLIARTLLDTEVGENTPYLDADSAYEQTSDSRHVRTKSFKLDFSTWYGKVLAILIAVIVLAILCVLLGILIPIMVVAGIIIYLVRFRPRR